MTYTKEEVVQKLVLAYKARCEEKNLDEISVSSIIQKASFKQDERNEIFKLFNLPSYEEILLHTNLFDVFSPQGKTHKVAKMKQTNATTEEKTMAENETKTEKLHDRIQKIRDALSEGLIEKEDVVRLLLLTAIAGESSFLLGAPGCGKSMLARRMALAFKVDVENGVKYFETLLNQFSTPEDVFGNISLKALNGELEECKGKEEYRRLTENMLPEADIAFLDEIWKASPAILNTLLTIINERKFHNGSKVMNVPLKALFAASNELPAKNKGLEALYDRFVLRLCVGYIKDEDSFFEMIDGSSSSEFELSDEVKKLQITNEELKAWKEKIDAVSLSDEAKAVISAIRKELVRRNNNMGDEDKKNGELFEVGDRRWKKIAHILKTSAFLNDRTEVDLMDCQLIEYCIWSTEKQQKMARDIVEDCIKQNGVDCDSAIEEIREQIEEFKTCVENEWFEEIEEAATDKIVVVDGQECYECTQYGTNETWYISVNEGRHCSYGEYHDFYTSSQDYYSHSYISRNGDIISSFSNFTIKKNPAKRHIEPKEFSDIAYKKRQKNFNKAHYAPIVDRINKQIEELKSQKEKDTVPFKANLFANQEYNESITAKLDSAIEELQDAKVSLDKERNRYLNGQKSESARTSKNTKAKQSTNNSGKSSCEMVLVAGGGMFRCEGSWQRSKVTVSSFEIGKFPVTQKLYKEVMNNNPSYFPGENCPVECVSWFDAVEFCNRLSKKDGLEPCYSGSGSNNIKCDFSKNGYRLPTEAEWEFAARGGNKSKDYSYAGSNDIDEVAWYFGNSFSETHEVGKKNPNELGIHDMSGNVWEWCNDLYGGYEYGDQTDPFGASSGDARVMRGGSWYDNGYFDHCTVSCRDFNTPDNRDRCIGFRIVRSSSVK